MDSGMASNMVPNGLAPQRCSVCDSTSRLLRCSSCKVVSYCGAAHQTAHRLQHRAVCTAIKKARGTFEAADSALRSHPGDATMPADPFNTIEGLFWGFGGTREYMRARFALADALLKVDTLRAVEEALGHLTDMLRLNRGDNMSLRNIVPALLLRLGREQECYDFIKWWELVRNKSDYNWGDTTLPYLDIHGADAFEPVDMFCSKFPNLSHLVTLILLKVRLRLDFSPFEGGEDDSFEVDEDDSSDGDEDDSSEGDEDDFESEFSGSESGFDRPVGTLVRAKVRSVGKRKISAIIKKLESQYRRLCKVVNDANPYFWEALVDEDVPPLPNFYSPGSVESAHLALHYCKKAWEESEDAITTIDAETWRFTRVYNGSAGDAGVGGTRASGPARTQEMREERPRATGKVFPLRFQPLLAAVSPTELFPARPIAGRGKTTRFVCHSDKTKVLVYVDGSCANNGQLNPRGGWAVVYGAPGPGEKGSPYTVSGRLESKGPFGDEHTPTSNRAELRAAIAALSVCDWRSEGFDSLVIATDSSYVVDGAADWAKAWLRNGWKTPTGESVKNKDLWDLLLGQVERWMERGLRVELWGILRELNTDADAAAKKAANERPLEVEFRDVVISSHQFTTAALNPRVLILCLEQESLFNDVFANLISQISSKARMEWATTHEAALSILDQETPPSVIIVADPSFARKKKIRERVIDRLRDGATVVLAGCFSSLITPPSFNRLFATIGLPWEMGSYHRTTVNLRSSVVGSRRAGQLTSSYSQKAVFAKNVAKSAIWYAESKTSKEAAAAFVRHERGMLGYVGDVNGEEASDTVVLAMCGLLD